MEIDLLNILLNQLDEQSNYNLHFLLLDDSSSLLSKGNFKMLINLSKWSILLFLDVGFVQSCLLSLSCLPCITIPLFSNISIHLLKISFSLPLLGCVIKISTSWPSGLPRLKPPVNSIIQSLSILVWIKSLINSNMSLHSDWLIRLTAKSS